MFLETWAIPPIPTRICLFLIPVRPAWFHLRFSGVADHYFYFRVFRAAVSPGRDADHHQGHGLGYEPLDGRERRGVSQRCGIHLYGTNGSASHHSTSAPGMHTVGTDDDYDGGNGACFRRHLAAYIGYGIKAENLLAAVIMTAPGTILMAKMLVPETEQPKTAGTVEISKEEMHKDAELLGAIARGTIDGGQLAFNVAIMLISFLALIAMVNGITVGRTTTSLLPAKYSKVLGVIFAPVAWLIGVPGKDIGAVGSLLGTRTVINELVAYSDLGAMKAALDPRSVTIATFALCGFANFSSIGIQIGGIGALAPNKRDQLAKLGFRAMIAGTMANLMSASIVGLLMRS